MTLNQQLAILQAAKDCKRVQFYDDEQDYEDESEAWSDIGPTHNFDFTYTYRICEPKKLEPWSTIEQVPFKQGVLWLKDSGGGLHLVTGVYIGFGSLHVTMGENAQLSLRLLEDSWLYADLSKNSTLTNCKWLPCGVEVEE